MMHQPTTNLADFGMALPYFSEAVVLQEGIAVANAPLTYGELCQLFGDQTIIVFGQTVDGQRWRLIYPDESAACWVIPCSAKPNPVRPGGQFVTYQEAGEATNAIANSYLHRRTD